MGTLIVWSSVQARLNTSDLAEMAQYIAQHGSAPYNSSQSAVCGVWLFFNIWAVNTVRAKYPAFNLPVIVYSIIVNIASTFGPRFPTVASAETFIRELLTAIFMGFAIGIGCSLFIFPVSTRQIVVKQMAGVLGLFKKTIALQKEYIHGLESDDMFTVEPTETSAGHPETESKSKKKKAAGAPKLTKEQQTAMALRGVTSATRELMGKIYGDLKFAKRDVAFGYLNAKDFGELFAQIRNIAIPLGGIGVIMDIFQRVARDRGWDGQPGSDELGTTPGEVDKGESQRMWNDIMKQLHEPFEILSEAMVQGLDHAGILLRFFPQPKDLKKTAAAADVEKSAAGLRPGQVGFSQVINDKIGAFNSRKGEILHLWAKEKGLSSDGKLENWDKDSTRLFEKRRNDQAQLFVLLYLEKLVSILQEHFNSPAIADCECARSRCKPQAKPCKTSWPSQRKSTATDPSLRSTSSSRMAAGCGSGSLAFSRTKIPPRMTRRTLWSAAATWCFSARAGCRRRTQSICRLTPSCRSWGMDCGTSRTSLGRLSQFLGYVLLVCATSVPLAFLSCAPRLSEL